MFGNIGPWELILILLVALIVVGPGKLPEVAKSIGKGINEFKRATSGVKKEFQDAINTDIISSKSSADTKSDEEPTDLAAVLNSKIISPINPDTESETTSEEAVKKNPVEEESTKEASK